MLSMVDQSQIDFGTIMPKQLVSKKVKFINNGRAPYTVTKLSVSCGCTQASIYPKVIQPGGEAELTIGMEGRAKTGPMKEQIILECAELPDRPLLIALRAFIDPIYQITPRRISFNAVLQSELPVVQLIKVRAALKHELPEKFEINSSNDFLNIQTVEVGDIENERRYLVTLKENAPFGEIDGTIILEAQEKDFLFPIKVGGQVIGDLKSDPSAIFFGNIAQGSSSTTRIKVEGFKWNSQCEVDMFPKKLAGQIKVETVDQKTLQVVFNARNEMPVGSLEGVILLKIFNNTGLSRVSVPFYAKIVQQAK